VPIARAARKTYCPDLMGWTASAPASMCHIMAVDEDHSEGGRPWERLPQSG
jgi:hypothetical protein